MLLVDLGIVVFDDWFVVVFKGVYWVLRRCGCNRKVGFVEFGVGRGFVGGIVVWVLGGCVGLDWGGRSGC